MANAPSAWSKKPLMVPSRKLDIGAPHYNPGTIATAFSSLAVTERREAVAEQLVTQTVATNELEVKEAVADLEVKAAAEDDSKLLVLQQGGKKVHKSSFQSKGKGRGPNDSKYNAVKSNADEADSWRRVTAKGKAK